MTIEPVLFYGLLLLAIAPAYATIAILFLYLKNLTRLMLKEKELQIAAVAGLPGGSDNLYRGEMDLKDFIELIQKKNTKSTEKPATIDTNKGHYL